MTICLSEPQLSLARQQAADAGFTDLSAYVLYLIDQAAEADAERADTLAALREGLADVAGGRVRPVGVAIAEIARKHGVTIPTGG